MCHRCVEDYACVKGASRLDKYDRRYSVGGEGNGYAGMASDGKMLLRYNNILECLKQLRNHS